MSLRFRANLVPIFQLDLGAIKMRNISKLSLTQKTNIDVLTKSSSIRAIVSPNWCPHVYLISKAQWNLNFNVV